MGLGTKAMLGDLGLEGEIEIMTDASAAKGIASRRGLGKVRHIEVNQLWVQEKVAHGDIKLTKVSGELNHADGLTKAIEREKIEWHLRETGQTISEGRHQLAPSI